MCLTINLLRKCAAETRRAVELRFAPVADIATWPTITSDAATDKHDTGTTGFTMVASKAFGRISLEEGALVSCVFDEPNKRYKVGLTANGVLVGKKAKAAARALASSMTNVFVVKFDDGSESIVGSQDVQSPLLKFDFDFQTGLVALELKPTNYIYPPVDYTATTPLPVLA